VLAKAARNTIMKMPIHSGSRNGTNATYLASEVTSLTIPLSFACSPFIDDHISPAALLEIFEAVLGLISSVDEEEDDICMLAGKSSSMKKNHDDDD
jgi:hypothetical protein